MLTVNTLDALAALPLIAEAVNALPTPDGPPPLIAVLEAAERWLGHRFRAPLLAALWAFRGCNERGIPLRGGERLVARVRDRWPFLERMTPAEFLAELRLPKGGRLTCVDGVGPAIIEGLRVAFLTPSTPAWGSAAP